LKRESLMVGITHSKAKQAINGPLIVKICSVT
jgi:hypothetical protein